MKRLGKTSRQLSFRVDQAARSDSLDLKKIRSIEDRLPLKEKSLATEQIYSIKPPDEKGAGHQR